MKRGQVKQHNVNVLVTQCLDSFFPDLRLSSSKAAAQQRSINLAISSRGIAALRAVDASAAERFLQTVIPMRGRMIHDIDGNLQSQPYDRDGQVCLSHSPIARFLYFATALCQVYQHCSVFAHFS
jgi:hypothetical protein